MKEQTVTCLYYHRVSPFKERLSIPPTIFEDQLRALSSKGYQTVSVSELIDFLSGKTLPAEKPLMLSFDDGFLDFFHHAFPLLKKLGMKAVVFLVPDWMNDADDLSVSETLAKGIEKTSLDQTVRLAQRGDKKFFLNWAMAREMAKSGLVEFGSHTMSHRIGFISGALRKFVTSDSAHWKYEALYGGAVHPGYPIFERASDVAIRCFLPRKDAVAKLAYFCQMRMKDKNIAGAQLESVLRKHALTLGPLGDFEGERDARDRVLNDFKSSKAIIEQRLGTQCQSLCWPFGDYSDMAMEMAEEAGYKLAFTTERGVIKKGDPRFALRRHRVERSSGPRLVLEISALGAPVIGAVVAGQSRSRKIVQNI
jgi:peptidoglycan/xylan/chitin deacetylase (PgdA/CDA1 family)